MSLTNRRLPEIVGWAQVSLMAHVIPFDRLEPRPAAAKNDELRIILQRTNRVAGPDDRGVLGLPRITPPQHLTGLEVEAEILAAVQMRQTEQHPIGHHPIGHMEGHLVGVPNVFGRPPIVLV